MGGIAYLDLKQSNKYTNDLYQENLTQIDLTYQNSLYIGQIRSDLFAIMLSTNLEKTNNYSIILPVLSAATEELTAGIDEVITSASTHLTKLTENLHEAINKFKV